MLDNELSEGKVFYISPEEAKNEIRKRWNNQELKKRVKEYLGNDIPVGFENEPRAVLFRNVIISDLEIGRFLDIARSIDLKPLCLEYVEDKFCTRSQDKLVLGKMPIFDKRDKAGNALMHYEKVVDLMQYDGTEISKVKTIWGESLVDFHHQLLKYNYRDIDLFDMSSWIMRNGHQASEYYRKFFALFICHGVLMESFVMGSGESQFFNEVIHPIYKEVKNYFGINPLLVDLYSDEEKQDDYWWCYPNSAKEFIIKKSI